MQNGQTEQYRVNIRVVWSKRLISRSRLPDTMHWLPRTNECGTPWRRESDRALPPQVGVGQGQQRFQRGLVAVVDVARAIFLVDGEVGDFGSVIWPSSAV